MATGVPKKKLTSGAELRIEYEGKLSRSEVLETRPAFTQQVWSGRKPSALKQLYYGDNLSILAKLLHEKKLHGKVKLIYIDPPFATQTVFHSRTLKHAYEDMLHGTEFIEFLRQRLILLHELLAENGSIYLHLDEKMVFHLKVVMDEIFGPKNFRNCITRKKCNPKNYTRLKYGNVSDYILFYTKSDDYIWNKPVEEWTDLRAKEYQYVEEGTGRRFMKVPVHAPGTRNGETGKPWRGVMPPPGKHWQFTPEILDELDKKGEIFWSSNGNPRRKVYLDTNSGVGVQDIWLEFRDAHNQNIHVTGYPTEKPRELLRRIIQASSKPGDLVLDCFAGSGTTLEVANETERNWIGIDNSIEAMKTILQRFSTGLKPMGDFRGTKKKSKTLPLFMNEEKPVADFELLAVDPSKVENVVKDFVSLLSSTTQRDKSNE